VKGEASRFPLGDGPWRSGSGRRPLSGATARRQETLWPLGGATARQQGILWPLSDATARRQETLWPLSGATARQQGILWTLSGATARQQLLTGGQTPCEVMNPRRAAPWKPRRGRRRPPFHLQKEIVFFESNQGDRSLIFLEPNMDVAARLAATSIL